MFFFNLLTLGASRPAIFEPVGTGVTGRVCLKAGRTAV